MTGISKLTAVAAPIAIDNLDTDRIFPARFTSLDRSLGGYGRCFLHDMRFDPDGKPVPGFILNDERLEGTRILVAGANYACGSGRPGAVLSQLDFGIRAIIAESFGAVFASVAYKVGLLAIQLPAEQVAWLRSQLQDRLGSELAIDLDDEVVVSPDGTRLPFAIDPFVKRLVAEGRSEVELTLGMEDRIADFEADRRSRAPWALADRHSAEPERTGPAAGRIS